MPKDFLLKVSRHSGNGVSYSVGLATRRNDPEGFRPDYITDLPRGKGIQRVNYRTARPTIFIGENLNEETGEELKFSYLL